MCCPPHRGQSFPAGSRGKFSLASRYGQATATNLQVRCAKFEIFLSKSSDRLLTMTWVSSWGAHTFFCSGDLITCATQWHSQGKRAGEGATWAVLLAGALCTSGVLPCAGAHPPGMLTLVSYPLHHLRSHAGIQGSLKESALSKIHAVLVCVFTLVLTKSEQPSPLEFLVTTRSLKVCFLSIYKVGVSASSAVYKLDLSLQFLVPCLYTPVKGIQ